MQTLDATQLPDRVDRGENAANKRARARNRKCDDARRAVYAALRAVDARERRNQSGEAIQRPGDEDTVEQPDIVVCPAPP